MKLFIACVLMVAVACIALAGARILFFDYVNAIPSSLQQKSCPGGASGNHTDTCTLVSCSHNFSNNCPPQVQVSKHCEAIRFCKPTIQSHLKFVVSVLHVYTKDIVVEITIDGHHNSAIAHANPPSTKGVTKFVIIDFKNIPGIRIGDEYDVCSWVKDNPDGNACNVPAKLTNLLVQHATVDTNDYED